MIRTHRLELFAAALMALSTIGSAWAAYESSRWSSVQTFRFNEGSAARVESTSLTTRGGQLAQVDVALFFRAIDALAADREKLFRFYVDRARPEFKPALEAWLATMPRTNPDAPMTPFELPEYKVEAFQQAQGLADAAVRAKGAALAANQRSDNYVLSVVIYAAVLFFAGVSSQLRTEQLRLGLLGVAAVGFVANSVWMTTFPVAISI